MPLSFEWDDTKSKSNLAKHGVGFEDASTIFGDPLSLTIPDPAHSQADVPHGLRSKSFSRTDLLMGSTICHGCTGPALATRSSLGYHIGALDFVTSGNRAVTLL
jgi:hypothetical protein